MVLIRNFIGRGLAFVAMLAVLAGTMAMPAAAQSETIYATLASGCTTYSSGWVATLQSGEPGFSAAPAPETVTFTFADGTVVDVGQTYSFGGTVRYRLADSDHSYAARGLVSITAQFDMSGYPSGRFLLQQGWPCGGLAPEPETYSVSGTILQRGNLKPVTPADVCLVELGVCTVTDGNGFFTFGDVPDGTYTLVSTAHIFKTLTATVTVEGGDAYVDLIQFRGRD